MTHGLYRMLVIVLALLLVAMMTNPSPERHRDKIKEKVAERNQLAGLLRLGDLAALVSSYRSLGVASYTTAGEHTLSVGAFGLVFVFEPKSRR